MISEAQNKQVNGEKTVVPVSATAVSKILNRYFYPASNGYAAMNVTAPSREEADQIYHATKKLLEPEAKVEEKSSENV
jgi:hypothetical protein